MGTIPMTPREHPGNETFFIDVDHAARRKWNQNVCGDAYASRRFENEGRLIAVLADGLGSGIKANILASMTAQMALRFVAAGIDVRRFSEVMMESLPVCQVRKIGYSTFTIVDCDQEGVVRVVEEGNPEFVLMRGGRPESVPYEVMTSKLFPDRHVHVYEMSLGAGDRLVACSDGVTQAGMCAARHPLGWRGEGLREFLVYSILRDETISSRDLARMVVEESMSKEPNGMPMDDTSCLVMYFRKPRKLLILSGPPYDDARDAEYAAIFDAFPGRKAICGGTTANLVARELGCRLDLNMNEADRSAGIPPASRMDGVDLVTEGIVTLTQVAHRLEDPQGGGGKDTAGRLIDLLLDSDSIEFLMGTRINEAHQDPTLPADLELRRNVMRRIAAALRVRHLKEITMSFI